MLPQTHRQKSAFTLSELMVTLAVFTIVMGGATSYLLSSSNFASYNEGKLLVNRDIRKFTSELSDYATYANYFKIYDTFASRNEVNDGGSGDFLLLGFHEASDPSKTTALIGYYRSATQSEEGPVQKFMLRFDPPSEEPIEDLMPSVDSAGSHMEVIELSKGLSDGKLFYNFFERSITVQGEILHSGSNFKRATNTYNFTVSPRG